MQEPRHYDFFPEEANLIAVSLRFSIKSRHFELHEKHFFNKKLKIFLFQYKVQNLLLNVKHNIR